MARLEELPEDDHVTLVDAQPQVKLIDERHLRFIKDAGVGTFARVSICLYNEDGLDPPSRPITPSPIGVTNGGGGDGVDSPQAASLAGSTGGASQRRGLGAGVGGFLGRSSTGRNSGDGRSSSKDMAALTGGGGGTRVAVKALQPHCSADAALMLRREAEILSALDHPNVVRCVGTGVWSTACGRPFMVQECVDGGTLQDKVVQRMTHGPRSKAAYPLAAALAWGSDVASALAYLHAQSPPIVHRDLKLENVLLSKDDPPFGRAVLADFGLARTLDPAAASAAATSPSEKDGAALISAAARIKGLAPTACTGSFIYMAPEVVRGEAYGVPADIFSLGIVLQELVSGVLTSAVVVGPTFNPRAGEAYARKVAGGFRRALPAGIPPALAALIEACWASDPAARPPASAVHASLLAIAADVEAAAAGGGGGGGGGGPTLDRSASRSSAGDGGGSGGGGGGPAAPATPGCMACSIM